MHNQQCQGPFRSACSIVLGSGSPRRKELLSSIGLTFSVCQAGVEELDQSSGLDPAELTMQNAMRKLGALERKCTGDVILCADTCVFCKGTILGKPSSFEDALGMLRFLDKKWHEVFTSFVLLRTSDGILKGTTVTSRVFLDVINEKVLRAYCSSEEPYDKAGGYAIQGSGAFLTRQIDGSYTNVVGLPITETVELLLELGAIEPCVSNWKK